MNYTIQTRYEEFTLIVKVRTEKPEKIHLTVKDATMPNTVFTDRYKTVNGDVTFFVRMPVSGQTAIVQVYNERIGNVPDGKDSTFQVLEIRKMPLEKKLDVIDLNNPKIRSFVNFATRFCFNAGWLKSGVYKSDDGQYEIDYRPTIVSYKTGKNLETPARISKQTGIIQVSQEKFIPMTVPMRMAILMHEYSHFYVNDDINNEIEADLNGLLIYLGLGYPRIEAYEAFLKTFVNTPSQLNKVRYDKINTFIQNFEKNNYILYE